MTSSLTPQDATLFRAFKSNLLSLISHELRTPLTGILNALNVLHENEGGTEEGFSTAELVHMARDNAQRLHRTLVSLLDLASLESGGFHARLKEVDLIRLVRGRLESIQPSLQGMGVLVRETLSHEASVPILGDPQKLRRAVDLCMQAVIPRLKQGTAIQIRISSAELHLRFEFGGGMKDLWESAWSHGIAGFEGGIGSPSSAFGGVMQSEQAFLSRLEEGLGSEFLLLHEIMRTHHGRLEQNHSKAEAELSLVMPKLSSEESLRAVLSSRAYQVSSELATVLLTLIQVPKDADPSVLCGLIKQNLFRSSDQAYSLNQRRQVALVIEDCKPADAPHVLKRIEKAVGATLVYGIAHCPDDGQDPEKLLDLAQTRLSSAIDA